MAGTAEVVVEVPLSIVAGMALELTLLLAGLSESLRMQSSAGPMLALTVLDRTQVSKATVTRNSDGAVSFALGRNQAEYVQAVLLRAYRDQVAEVNHVHIEGELAEAPFDLTIMFDLAREPMSPEEAAKRMAD